MLGGGLAGIYLPIGAGVRMAFRVGFSNGVGAALKSNETNGTAAIRLEQFFHGAGDSAVD